MFAITVIATIKVQPFVISYSLVLFALAMSTSSPDPGPYFSLAYNTDWKTMAMISAESCRRMDEESRVDLYNRGARNNEQARWLWGPWKFSAGGGAGVLLVRDAAAGR